MRNILLAGLAMGVLLGGAPQAVASYQGPWCAVVQYGFDWVGEECDMPNFEVCRRVALSYGPTGFCVQNPRFPGYWEDATEQPPRRKHRRTGRGTR